MRLRATIHDRVLPIEGLSICHWKTEHYAPCRVSKPLTIPHSHAPHRLRCEWGKKAAKKWWAQSGKVLDHATRRIFPALKLPFSHHQCVLAPFLRLNDQKRHYRRYFLIGRNLLTAPLSDASRYLIIIFCLSLAHNALFEPIRMDMKVMSMFTHLQEGQTKKQYMCLWL